MLLDWFRRNPEDPMGAVVAQVRAMLTDARHSFDLAMGALLAGADPDAVVEEVRATDQAINAAEQEVRRRLLVHAAVQGSGDIDTVLAYFMLSRKIERIGDQAKNILDLALEGVDLSGAADASELRALRDEISAAFATAIAILDPASSGDAAAFRSAMNDAARANETKLRSLLHSDAPASEAVPRALLFRYLKRIAANLGGVASTLTDPFDQIDHRDGDADD